MYIVLKDTLGITVGTLNMDQGAGYGFIPGDTIVFPDETGNPKTVMIESRKFTVNERGYQPHAFFTVKVL
jgi:hypothetical protein